MSQHLGHEVGVAGGEDLHEHLDEAHALHAEHDV